MELSPRWPAAAGNSGERDKHEELFHKINCGLS
jgi:hypothetical protein